MIRVFNFASQPLQVIRELSRVIAPGGFLIISVNPKPSLATLVDDIKHHAYNENPSLRKLKSVTFSRENTSQIFPASFTTFAHKRKFMRHLFKTNGFMECMRISSGLEDYSFLKFLPMKFFLAIGSIFHKFSLFPTTFFLLQKKGTLKESFPATLDILQCPRCGSGLPNRGPDLACGKCGTSYKMDDDILDMTYLPEEAKIAE
ncbi:MAG: Trm112 family protein [Thermoplasmataceae archaeon]